MTYNPTIPIEVGPTSPRTHITGQRALEIPCRRHRGGCSCCRSNAWFREARQPPSWPDVTTEEQYGPLLDVLGRSGLRDARPGLARLGHPAAAYPRKVWAATHERAVIEMTWKALYESRYRDAARQRPIPAFYFDDLPTVYPDQVLRLHWWAWRLRKAVPPERLAVWDSWRREWWDEMMRCLKGGC